MPGTLVHLSSRFFDVLLAKPLDSAERATVEWWLPTPELIGIFFDQPVADQRHGYEAALIVLQSDADRDTVVAAVMHDTGKRHASLGLVGRVVASLLIKLRLPLTERMRLYRDHEITAARELAGAGAPPLAIDFALHHHHERPDSIPTEVWETLIQADQPKAARWSISGISSGAG